MEFKIPNSKWIWVSDLALLKPDSANLVLFRKAFQLEAVQPCQLRVSADTRYKLYCNGELVAFGPAKGDKSVWYYDEVDLTSHLRPGKNVLCAEVLQYPALHGRGNHSLFRTDSPGLYVEEMYEGLREPTCQTMDEIGEDTENPTSHGRLGLTAGGSWKWRYVDGFQTVQESFGFAPLMFMEGVKADPALQSWKLPGFDDSGWANARPYSTFQMSTAVVPGNLLPRPIPPMYREGKKFQGLVQVKQSASPADSWERMLQGQGKITIPAHTEETVDINVGCEETGFLSLRMGGGKNAAVTLLCSEAYGVRDEAEAQNPFALTVKTDRCDHVNGELYGFTDTYRVSGAGTGAAPEAYEPFWFRTFRFVRLAVKTEDESLVISGFDYKETGYPLEVKTNLETSDPSMAAIWDISERTLRRCMQETYTDCPFYEQLQYAMDSRSQILYTYMTAADDRLARNCMEDFRRSQRYDGMLNCSYPCYEPNIIPGFSIYYILMLWDHMMFFGDREFLKGHMACVDGILHFFDSHLDERGLVGKVGGVNGRDRYWSFIDWTDQWDGTAGVPTATLQGPITMESLLYIYGLQAAAEVAEFVGRAEIAGEYRTRAEAVQEAVRKHCMDETGRVMDGPGVKEYSQHGQVFALLTGTLSLDQGRANLQKTLDQPKEYAQCSVAMAYYLFRALEKAGLYQETDRYWDIWREMVKNNMTTCVEDNVRGRSDCHAWGALALYELPAIVLGIRPCAPGFAKAEIRPVPGHFTRAKGQVATPLGMVEVSWKKTDEGRLDLTYKVPDSMSVEVKT